MVSRFNPPAGSAGLSGMRRLHVVLQVALVSVFLGAELALELLVAGVHDQVSSECRRRHETLCAVGTVIGINVQVPVLVFF